MIVSYKVGLFNFPLITMLIKFKLVTVVLSAMTFTVYSTTDTLQ